MKKFYLKAFLFWFVLLALAFLNATVRETTYKPLFTPFIGIWAHQISSVTAMLLFYGAIYFFLKKIKDNFNQKDLLVVGVVWVIMTVVFECFMNGFVRKLSFEEVLSTYYFWKGETWIFVLLSLIIFPQIIYKQLRKKID